MGIKLFRKLKTRTKVFLAFGFVLVFIIFIHLISLYTLQNFRNIQQWISHTRLVIAEVEELERVVTEYESNVRGYVISGDKSFFPSSNIHDSAQMHLRYIQMLTIDNPAQQARIAALEKDLNKKLDFTNRILTTLTNDNKAEAEKLISTSLGRRLMRTVKEQLAQIKAAENILLKQSIEDAEGRYNKTLFSSSFSRLIGIIILALLAVFIVRDIEKQQKLKEQLKESESTLKQYFDALPFALAVIDKYGKVLYSNKARSSIFPENGETHENTNFEDIFKRYDILKTGTNEPYPAEDYPLAKALRGEDVYIEDIDLKHGNLSVPVAITAKPIRNISGEIESVITIIINISDRRIYEKELRAAKDSAESNVVARERFLANMSHEIRTPMNAIIGFAGLLSNTSLKDEQEEYVRAIRSAGDNLLTIINDILDVSKIEAGMLSIEEVPFSIYTLLDSIRVLLQQKAKEKNLQLTVSDDIAIPEYLIGDPVRITQILINLISNAIKFTEKGTVSINVKLKELTTNDNVELLFEVKDTGIGIAKDKLSEIFTRFSQGSSDTTRKFGGTGLGLSIVQSLVEMMNGRIEVTSELGKGSCFRIFLPFKQPSNRELSFLDPDGYIDELECSNLHILIVEDNILNQRLAEKLLEKMGHSSQIAMNGLIATELIRTGSNFDLILMDIQMPEMDGYEAANVIRNILKSDVPIIAMTAHAMPGEKEKCIGMGMNDYIPKPIKVKELQNKISRLASGISNKKSGKVNTPKPDALANSGQYCNFTQLEEMADGNTDFIIEMLQLYLTHAPNDIEGIEAALNINNIAEAGRLAHKMKSSSSILGNSAYSEMLKKLEILCLENGSRGDIHGTFSSVQQLHKKTIQELMAKLDRLNQA